VRFVHKLPALRVNRSVGHPMHKRRNVPWFISDGHAACIYHILQTFSTWCLIAEVYALLRWAKRSPHTYPHVQDIHG
jgi:hypothetical protein